MHISSLLDRARYEVRFVPSIILWVTLCLAFLHSGDSLAGPAVQELLPDSAAAGEWQQNREHFHTPDDLYNYINGAADLFLSYGFVELAGGTYLYGSEEQGTVIVDIYDMGEKLNAFGIFQSKRDPEVKLLDIGAGAIGSEKYVFFYKDRFYVEIQSFVSSEKGSSAALKMAREVESKIPGDSSPPAELNYLTPVDQVSGSVLYITGGILGHGFLDRGLLCDYRVGDEAVQAFIVFFPSRDQAIKALSQYKNYIDKSGEKWETRTGFGENSFTAQEPYHNTILVGQQGPFVVGIADLPQVQKGEALLKRILSTLQQQQVSEGRSKNKK